MTAPRDVLIEAGHLAAERKPYAFATVVRVERPTSAQQGNHALIKPDGDVLGWIGGACSCATVVREALGAIADGRPRLVAIEGSCASEGLVEVFIEPQLPEPLLTVLGAGPAAQTLADLAARIGWRVTREVDPDAEAVVVATMGAGDEAGLTAALETRAGYVGLVASPKRGTATLKALRDEGADEDALARIRCPAGLDLGPSSQEEIAVSILAELVAWRHRKGEVMSLARTADSEAGRDASRSRAWLGSAPDPSEATDPVCGMTVSVEGARETADHDGLVYYFCGAVCRRRFESDPTPYVEVKIP